MLTKPYGWIIGYTRKGSYHIFRRERALPRSVESVDLVVPKKKETKIPSGCKVRQTFKVDSPRRKEDRLIVNVPREKIDKFDVNGLDTEEFLKAPAAREKHPKTEYDIQIEAIRKALKKLCPTLSVKRGRGTGYSWIDIHGSKDEFGHFTDDENKALETLGVRGVGSNCALISPEDRRYYYKKAKNLLENLKPNNLNYFL